MKIFKFYSGLFVLVHVRISQRDFDNMWCSLNSGHVICMIVFHRRVANYGRKESAQNCQKKK